MMFAKLTSYFYPICNLSILPRMYGYASEVIVISLVVLAIDKCTHSTRLFHTDACKSMIHEPGFPLNLKTL